jgi:hypothetical protein
MAVALWVGGEQYQVSLDDIAEGVTKNRTSLATLWAYFTDFFLLNVNVTTLGHAYLLCKSHQNRFEYFFVFQFEACDASLLGVRIIELQS